MEQHCKRIVRTRNLALAAIALAASTLMAVPGQATPPSGFVGTQIAKGVYPPMQITADKEAKWDLKLTTKDTSDIYVTRNAIAVGGESGWHTHPGPSLITVTVGAVTVYEAHDPLCSPKVVHAGEGSIDIGSGHVHMIRNETGAPAETVAVQFLPQGATRRIDADAPSNCNP